MCLSNAVDHNICSIGTPWIDLRKQFCCEFSGSIYDCGDQLSEKNNLNFDTLHIPVFVVGFPSVDDLQLVDQDDAS